MSTGPPSDEIDPDREISGHLLALYGWKIERQKGIFGHGERGALIASVEMRWTTKFLPDANELGHVRHHILAPPRNKAG